MASLRAHLREDGDHGRLGFHPACPVCCDDRLAGRLPSDALVSVRAKALLATGVLAASAASPASVLAADGDTQGASSVSSEDFADPNAAAGNSDDLPVDESAPAPADPDDDAGPLGPDLAEQGDPGAAGDQPAKETPTPPPAATPTPGATAAPVAAKPEPGDGAAPTTGLDGSTAPSAPSGASGSGGSTASAPSGATGTGGSTAATAPASAPAATDGSPAPTAPAAPVAAGRQKPATMHGAPERAAARAATGAAARKVAAVERGRVRYRPPSRAVEPLRTRVVVAVAQQAAPAVPVREVSAAVTTRVVRSAGAPDVRRARPGDRGHVVAAGESLWSIASDVLGGRATVAGVAREVNRLWDLNRARIGTGNRDLLPVGTRLVLE